ncbi:MAG: SH3 domain-containing protein, partial [Bacteroidales bacterium]|nr:SH3 domain-containing protein [Bacteroidales bacterium]
MFMLISTSLPYVPVRLEPSHRSEQVTQMLFGELADVTNENEEWLEITLNDDGYSGWIERKVTFFIDNSDNLSPLKTVNDPTLKVTNGFVVQQLPCGALLHEFSEDNHSFTCNQSSFYYENGLETDTQKNALNIVSLA